MASPYVHGPAHLFVGIEFSLFGLLGQATLQGSPGRTFEDFLGSLQNIASSGSVTDTPQGATLNNNPNRPAPATLVSNVVLATRQPVYLGTAERATVAEIQPGWTPWYDDEMGTTIPADELYEAEEAFVTADISRWNEPVYAFLAQRVNRAPLGGGRGINFAGDVGTSMVYEGYCYPLWIQFPFAGKLGYALRGMPPGYRFFNAMLAGPERLDPLGTQPSKRRLIWRCREYLDLESGAMALYDHFMGALPVIN